MKTKVMKTVVTYPDTTSALAMEKACKKHAVPGRIIPVPNEITAGCGFAWCAPCEERESVESFIAEQGLRVSGVYSIEIVELSEKK